MSASYEIFELNGIRVNEGLDVTGWKHQQRISFVFLSYFVDYVSLICVPSCVCF